MSRRLLGLILHERKTFDALFKFVDEDGKIKTGSLYNSGAIHRYEFTDEVYLKYGEIASDWGKMYTMLCTSGQIEMDFVSGMSRHTLSFSGPASCEFEAYSTAFPPYLDGCTYKHTYRLKGIRHRLRHPLIGHLFKIDDREKCLYVDDWKPGLQCPWDHVRVHGFGFSPKEDTDGMRQCWWILVVEEECLSAPPRPAL